jgi:superfamily II DNA or RNA helicase
VTAYKYKTTPYPHQVRALRKLLRNRGGGLQVQMRWGKSKVAIDFAGAMHLLEGIQRVLVICPLSVVGVWEDEIKKHSDNWIFTDYPPPSSFWRQAGSPLGNLPQEFIEWKIVNFHRVFDRYRNEDGTWYPIPNQELHDYKPDLVIVDESHHIGTPGSEISKQTYLLGKSAKYRVILTGTMFHRKPQYVFGQFKFLDSSIFGTAFKPFKDRIMVMGGYGDYEVLRYINLKWMMSKIKPRVYISKYVPPRNAVTNVLHYHLDGRNLAYYAEMEKESMITVGGEQVISPIVLSRHLRAQMICGGWIKTETRYRRVGDSKKRIATERINEYAEQDITHFVVGCRFIPELRDVYDICHKAGYDVVLFHGGLSKDERTARIKRFQDSTQPTVFVAQVASAKEGISLSRASVMMFYSLPESFLDFDQFRSRIIEYGNDKTLMYDILVAWSTREEVTWEALKLKQDVAQFIVKHPRRVEEITAKKFKK